MSTCEGRSRGLGKACCEGDLPVAGLVLTSLQEYIFFCRYIKTSHSLKKKKSLFKGTDLEIRGPIGLVSGENSSRQEAEVSAEGMSVTEGQACR